MSKPLCLVTGASGFVGGHLVELLSARGYPVRATDHPAAVGLDDPGAGRFAGVLDRAGVEVVPVDLTDPSGLDRAVRNVRLCFHCAAETRPGVSFSQRERVNYDGTRVLVDRLLAQSSFSKLVLWSDGGVYDPGADLPWTEASPVAPSDDLRRTKVMAERLVADYGADQGLRYTVVRPARIYGPRGVRGVGRLLRLAARGPVTLCPSNWQHRVDLVHVRDVCEAALALALDPATDGEIFNLADNGELTNVALLRTVASTVGTPFVSLPPVGPALGRAVLAPAERALGWLSATLAGRPPPGETTVADVLAQDRVLSPRKLLDTGFEHRYPDARQGLADTVLWLQRNGFL